MSSKSMMNWEIFVQKIAEVLAFALTTKETESIVRSFNQLSERVRELSSSNLKTVEEEAQTKRKFCRHEGLCRQNCIRGFLRAFVAAYAVKYLVGLVQNLMNGRLLTRPSLMISSLDRDTLRFAAFFGSFIGGFKGLNCFLRRLRGVEDGWNGFLAGAIAGLSLSFDQKQRREAVALYLSTRSLQYLFNVLLKYRYVPHIPHGDTILMSLLNVQIIYAFMAHPDTIAKSYYYMIYNLADFKHYFGKAGALEAKKVVTYLTNQQVPPPELYNPVMEKAESLLAAQLPNMGFLEKAVTSTTSAIWSLFFGKASLSPNHHIFGNCAITHPDTTSCTWGSLTYSTRCFPLALRMYLPLNLAMMLVFKFKMLLQNPGKCFLKAFISSMRSSLFITLFSTLAWLPPCYSRNIAGRDITFGYLINGLIAGSTVLVEQPSRRLELAIYCVPRAVESFWNMMVKKGYLRNIPNGEILYFSLAMGTLLTLYQNEMECAPPAYEPVLASLFGKN